MKKIGELLKRKNKGFILLDKLRRFFQIRNKIIYKNFGIKSLILKPIRILGKKNISIGNNVTILNSARIEADSTSNSTKLFISDGVQIAQNTHIISYNKVIIEKNTLISANVFISDLNHMYSDINLPVMLQNNILEETIIGEECFIGYGAVIMPGVHLGKHCIVGANCVVLKGEYDDYSVIVGVPGMVVKKYDSKLEKWVKVRKR